MQYTSLTNGQKNLCEYGGVIGILLSLTCLIQHLILAIPSAVTNPMIPAYVFATIAFVLLSLQKQVSIILLIISFVFIFIINAVWIRHFSFSLAVLLLLIYHVIAIIILFVEKIPMKLKLKAATEKAERDSWANKL